MIRIIIADDQTLTREGLRTILDLEDDMTVVGVAKDGEEAYALTARLSPDLVMMDIQMPNMDGIAALQKIKQQFPAIFVLILSTFLEDRYIVDGMASGASGYLLKDMDSDKMIAAIRDTVAGQFTLPSAVAARLAQRIAKVSAEVPEVFRHRRLDLTEREKEISRLIMKGCSNREIAAELFIAEGTVRNYISTLYSKLDVVDRVQAVVRLQTIL